MKSSLMTSEMMMKTLMISKAANSALHIPVFSEDCSTVWILISRHITYFSPQKFNWYTDVKFIKLKLLWL